MAMIKKSTIHWESAQVSDKAAKCIKCGKVVLITSKTISQLCDECKAANKIKIIKKF